MKTTHNRIMEIEEQLIDSGVFTNAISGEICDMFSYMTVLSYNNFDKFYRTSDVIKEEWIDCAEYYEGKAYLSPIAKLLSLTIKRYLNNK